MCYTSQTIIKKQTSLVGLKNITSMMEIRSPLLINMDGYVGMLCPTSKATVIGARRRCTEKIELE